LIDFSRFAHHQFAAAGIFKSALSVFNPVTFSDVYKAPDEGAAASSITRLTVAC
jgi:hypothetical protein